ncbi:MAG: TIGR00295 family protein [Methanobrevibacter sp.]|uniref:TIGR00295 family protein n=1 Tax=Methanobrevibacter sp. TaxID=66852 RepID=UPI0026E0B84E|nr:TIGR00295 family protein [Methanobrevibacter sp.]MDO5848452.1 TIGR00295 family protein [Methanobrevibacter sp.]
MEIEVLKKAKCPENVIDHCIAVYKKSMKMAKDFDNVDLDLIKTGSLLHDIGRSKTHGIKHAIEGAKIAEELGYDEKVCNIIERHIGAGITEKEAEELGLPIKSYVPQTLEEKIVAHSDNLISGTEEVDLNFVIDKIRRKVDNPEEKIDRLILLHNELKQA